MWRKCDMDDEEIKNVVKEGYAKIAKEGKVLSIPVTSCCGGASLAEEISKMVGHTEQVIKRRR